jgi:hypothetical protein
MSQDEGQDAGKADDDDDDLEFEDDDEEFDDPELEALLKPQPKVWKDGYSGADRKPVSLVVPSRADAYRVIGDVAEARFPAKKVAKSAIELAKTLRALMRK